VRCDLLSRHNDGVDIFCVLGGVDGALLETDLQCTDYQAGCAVVA